MQVVRNPSLAETTMSGEAEERCEECCRVRIAHCSDPTHCGFPQSIASRGTEEEAGDI